MNKHIFLNNINFYIFADIYYALIFRLEKAKNYWEIYKKVKTFFLHIHSWKPALHHFLNCQVQLY